jgi:DNA-binding MarR family transcriptional regulator
MQPVRQTNSEDLTFYEDPSHSLGYLCRIAFRHFSRALEKRTLPKGVSSGQWRFLRVLWTEDGLTQRELSRRVGMREPTTVTALKRLERSGLIRRAGSEMDRRKVHVHLTAKAVALKAELMPMVAEVNVLATRGMKPGDVALLRDLLERLAANLADEARSVTPRAEEGLP